LFSIILLFIFVSIMARNFKNPWDAENAAVLDTTALDTTAVEGEDDKADAGGGVGGGAPPKKRNLGLPANFVLKNLNTEEQVGFEFLFGVLQNEWAAQSTTVKNIMEAATTSTKKIHIYVLDGNNLTTQTKSELFNFTKTLEDYWIRNGTSSGLTLQSKNPEDKIRFNTIFDKRILNDPELSTVAKDSYALVILDEMKHIATARKGDEGELQDHKELYSALKSELDAGTLTVSPGCATMIDDKYQRFCKL
jgi:hypothetical protein